ncbi:hypothetical protein, partial [Gilliamella sp. B3367]|uniref:hypothetical protein n=1 Tax=Gilliamella sp. B3367 TaxID=2817989 RepID=UPI00226A4CBB
YTPSNNSSSTTPIVLPVEGQSFADIRMFVPTDTNSVDLSTLIGPPNNYWGDDDGDSGVSATGRLSLSIVDKNGQSVSRNSVLTTCNSPYKVTLSSTDGTLSTRYGFPNRSTFSARSEIYYVNPKAGPVVCFARPHLVGGIASPASIWDSAKGFLTQETDPSLYGRNFPTTGANKLYFDLLISGVSQPLSWSAVSLGGITATMSNSTATSVRVTLTGPYATTSQQSSSNPGPISKPTLPQTFELVGRDSNGTPVVKYGFTLKQWFVNRGFKNDTYPNTLSWCRRIGYRVPKVKDLTNASCRNTGLTCQGAVSATPSSPRNHFMPHIGAGFFAEWLNMRNYSGASFVSWGNWTSDPYNGTEQFIVNSGNGDINSYSINSSVVNGLCAHP